MYTIGPVNYGPPYYQYEHEITRTCYSVVTETSGRLYIYEDAGDSLVLDYCPPLSHSGLALYH